MLNLEEKNSIFAEGLYLFFADMCETQQHKKQTKDQEESGKKRDRALKKVTELKNVARSELWKARSEEIDEERVKSIAKSFNQLL